MRWGWGRAGVSWLFLLLLLLLLLEGGGGREERRGKIKGRRDEGRAGQGRAVVRADTR